MITIIGTSQFHRTMVVMKAKDDVHPTVSRRALKNAKTKLCAQKDCGCEKRWYKVGLNNDFIRVAPFRIYDDVRREYEFFDMEGGEQNDKAFL